MVRGYQKERRDFAERSKLRDMVERFQVDGALLHTMSGTGLPCVRLNHESFGEESDSPSRDQCFGEGPRRKRAA